MNRLPEMKQATLVGSLCAGLSIRESAAEAGCSKATALTYAQILRSAGLLPRCACGAEAGHRGWCHERLNRHPSRQEFLRSRWGRTFRYGVRWGRTPAPIRLPIPSVWPFIAQPRGDHALLLKINESLPRQLDEVVRQEAGQEIALAILAGELTEEDLNRETANRFVRSIMKTYPRKHGSPLSLDAPPPWDRAGRPLSETIADLRDHWRGSGETLEFCFRASSGEVVKVNRAELPQLDLDVVREYPRFTIQFVRGEWIVGLCRQQDSWERLGATPTQPDAREAVYRLAAEMDVEPLWDMRPKRAR